MAHRVADDVQESSTGSGTGNLTLAGAVGNYRTFAEVGFVNNDTADVTIEHVTLNEKEQCRVTWTTGGVLVRGTPVRSTNGGAPVNFSAGGLKITLMDPAGSVRWFDDQAAHPAPPPSGLHLYARNLAGKRIPYVIGPSGDSWALQAALWRNRRQEYVPQGNGTTVTLIAFGATNTGTATSRAVATTDFFSWIRRLGFVSAGTAGSSAGTRHGIAQVGLGNAAGRGGFLYPARFGISDAAAVADARLFVGMLNATAVIGNVNPSTLTNMIGVGCDNAQTTLRIMHNDASGAATTIDLGASFPANTRNTDLYELVLYCPPNGTTVGYRVERLNTGDVATGTISTDLPSSTTLLSPQIWRNNGATAAAVGIDVAGQYIETDN